MVAYEYGNPASDRVLIQPVDDHDLAGIENEAAVLAKLAGQDFRLIAVKIEDKPGSLAKIICALSEADISVEYTYAFTSSEPGIAVMAFRVNNNEKAVSALVKAGIGVAI